MAGDRSAEFWRQRAERLQDRVSLLQGILGLLAVALLLSLI
jgi:hypothetical protein